jgi:ParB family chromosome partitioning protein
MLGKGLESLIPKNNQGQGQGTDGGPAFGNNVARDNNAQQPQFQPAQPQNSQFQYQPQSQPVQPQPRPSFVPSVQPPVQPSAQPFVQPQARPLEQNREQYPIESRPIERATQYQPSQPQPQSQPQSQSSHQPQPQKRDDLAQESIFHIEIEKITPNPDQPRRHFDQDALHELASSIREFGFLQPLVVSKMEKETSTGVTVEYQIIAGERRFMAAKMLGLPRVPAIVRNINLEREKLELGVIENIQRENLNPIEMARAFQRLQEEFRMTQREIAAKLGKSREVVANAVRLLDLPEYIQRAVEEGALSESNARLLIAIEDPTAQKALLEDIIQNKLTTRDVKERVQRTIGAGGINVSGAPRRGRPPLQETRLAPEVKALQDELSSSLGAPVEISKNANNGKITITFFSEEELEDILRKLGKERE